jgi:hypothetical protein
MGAKSPRDEGEIGDKVRTVHDGLQKDPDQVSDNGSPGRGKEPESLDFG